ncbi:hypothetical protein HY024_04655 [Candidatus Curtissbacteria bacterium]|nr:hypothetical protein [Candidatus Curtissbacteria bacterium]
MQKGFSLITVLIGIGIFVLIGSVVAATLVFKQSKDVATTSGAGPQAKDKNSTDQFSQLDKTGNPIAGAPAQSSPIPSTTPLPSTAPASATLYKQPQDLYQLTLPSGWVVASTFATKTYSTTKFSGPIGNISITFGSGKDPSGGCSETSSITLADRIISGCYLLQKDGSRILTRAYTSDKAGLPITVEAYINAPLASNQPEVVSVLKTIDIY